MSFLIPSDFEVQTRKDIRALLTVDDPKALQKAERTAISMMKSYLENRYDMAKVFFDVLEFDIDEEYIIGQFVFWKADDTEDSEYQVYTCIQDTNGNEPSDIDYFEPSDPRNHFIVMLCIDILIYHKYSGRSMRTIPEFRVDRYNDAIEWLIEASTGKNINVLPAKEKSEQKSEFRYGGYDKEEHRY